MGREDGFIQEKHLSCGLGRGKVRSAWRAGGTVKEGAGKVKVGGGWLRDVLGDDCVF